MKLLSSEEMQELRIEIAALSISDQRKDELIRFLDAVAVSFIDQAFGLNSTQLSLSARANYAFNGPKTHANLPTSGVAGPVDLDNEGAINTFGPQKSGARHLAP
jgi:hypothetical protein